MLANLEQAYAPSSRINLKTQHKLYLEFCEYFGLVALPATHKTICMYAEFLTCKFSAPGTVKHYINGARVLRSLKCLDTAQFEHQCVVLFLRGMSRRLQHAPRQALPITPAILLEMERSLNFSKEIDCTILGHAVVMFLHHGKKV